MVTLDAVTAYTSMDIARQSSHAGIHNGTLDPGQVQYTTAYDANIVAQAGHTVFTKSMNIDTRNKVIVTVQPGCKDRTYLCCNR